MKSFLRVSLRWLLCTALFVAMYGCQTVRQATGTHYAYLSANPERVVNAAKKACEDMELHAIAASSTEMDGRIEARTAQGKKVSILVTKQAEDVSTVAVKVGTVGDEAISRAIIDKTEDRIDGIN